MATPVKSVQFRDAPSLIEFYRREQIPCFGIKQNTALCNKYEGDDLEEGITRLEWICTTLIRNKTTAIYTLCLYNRFDGEITDKTPASLSNNFRFCEYEEQVGFPGTGSADLAQQVRELRAEIKAMKENPEENKLGVIGEILEMDAVQPLLLAIGTKIADWVTGTGKVGELRRIAGIPEPKLQQPADMIDWRADNRVASALDRLSKHVSDLPDLLQRLANMAETKPAKFGSYLALFKMM